MQQHEICLLADGGGHYAVVISRVESFHDGITVTITNVGYGPHKQGRTPTCIADEEGDIRLIIS